MSSERKINLNHYILNVKNKWLVHLRVGRLAVYLNEKPVLADD